MTEALFLTSEETRGLATMREYVDAVREGYREVGTGAAAKPRQKLPNSDPPGFLTSYLAVLPETGAMGGYTYAAGFGAADAHFFLPLFDAHSGEPLALLDGAAMNPYKTGAAGGVAADALARPDASVVAVIGSGAQAKGQVRALAAVRDLATVNVYSPTKESRESFAASMNEELDAAVGAVSSSDAAVEGADVVVTATNAAEPVFDGDVLEPGTHVTAMGQYDPSKRELDTGTVANAKYVPDLRERAFSDSGEFLQAREEGAIDDDHVHADLGEVVAGEAPGRENRDEITVFDSGGTGVETVAAGYMLFETAREEGLGTGIDLAPASEALR
ncbi:ornithine cyclodeaminase family protein [Halosegnis marinus]|uniref:Ornithine cyclodeaminase family protein n=1 Tax=Halosegnis marinus TaxID=3034023 RepID=A0ABD5ZSL1_9EURY|nr:ornithine cyclodeaminase family protein [Halosegnis sp. DT85]